MHPIGLTERFRQGVRAGGRQSAVVDAYYNGTLVPGGAALPIDAGAVEDDSTPGVRRTLSCSIVAEPGLFDLLAPIGTQLRVSTALRYGDGSTDSVPMGRFEVDASAMGYAPNQQTIKITAPDRYRRIQRARFLTPQASTPGALVTDQITTLIRGALGAGEPVTVTATSTATVGAVTWDTDRAKAIEELAESIGAWVYMDRDGTATLADLPTLGVDAVWLVDASQSGILLTADRQVNRQRTYNVVVAATDKTDGVAPFEPQIVWDSDPASPTYAGTDPATGAGVGPFGIVPYFHTSALYATAGQALAGAGTILARVAGLNRQLQLTSVRNPALDALDAVDVLLPQERYDIPRPSERHLVDTVTHPLMVDQAQAITGRSTRTDPFT